MLRFLAILGLLLTLTSTASAQKKQPPPGERWSKEKAAAWYKEQPWPVGCNFIPSTAINQLEMWQADTWDPKTIDRELGWAEDLGFTSVRVFLHDLPHATDREGYFRRINEFLQLAHKHRISVMFVLFDSCWHPEPKAGKQPAPTPHLHNSGWVQCPGVAVLKDREEWKKREAYVKDVLGAFRNDRRILAWDLWNEPENNNASSYGDRDIKDKEKVVLPLVKEVFQWAREVKVVQPITAAPWIGDWSSEEKLSPLNRFLFDNSDIITFHRYEDLPSTKKSVESLVRYERPILCTEYMARPIGSTFDTILPYFKEKAVGAYNWGFVAGKTQTQYPWDSWKKKYDAEPSTWFHDIFYADGTPYDVRELPLIRRLAQKAITVHLRFSENPLDPRKPGDAFVECVVKNRSEKELAVPSKYAGGWDSLMVLRSGYLNAEGAGPGMNPFLSDLRLVKWAAPTSKETKLVKAGEDLTVFKDEVAKVLVLDTDKVKPLKPKEERYYWSWQACPSPPPSPVWWPDVQRPDDKVFNNAVFQMQVRVDGKWYESESVVLKLKGIEKKKK